ARVRDRIASSGRSRSSYGYRCGALLSHNSSDGKDVWRSLDMQKVGSTVTHYISSYMVRRFHEGRCRRCGVSLHDISPLNARCSSVGGLVYIGFLLLLNTN